MLDNNHLLELVLAFLPAFLYAYLIQLADRSINLRGAMTFLVGGLLSMIFLQAVQDVFPDFQDLLFSLLWLSDVYPAMPDATIRLYSLAFFSFVQIALLEEAIKLAAFRVASWIRGEQKDPLFATAFHCCMISVGFAGYENLQYFIEMPHSDVIVRRTLSTVVVHMTCGFIMGYGLALSRLHERRSMAILGLLCAVAFHGSFDFLVFEAQDIRWTFPMDKVVISIPPFYLLSSAGALIILLLSLDLRRRSRAYVRVPRTSNPSPPEG